MNNYFIEYFKYKIFLKSLNSKYSMIIPLINNFLKTLIQNLTCFIKYDIKRYVFHKS